MVHDGHKWSDVEAYGCRSGCAERADYVAATAALLMRRPSCVKQRRSAFDHQQIVNSE